MFSKRLVDAAMVRFVGFLFLFTSNGFVTLKEEQKRVLKAFQIDPRWPWWELC